MLGQEIDRIEFPCVVRYRFTVRSARSPSDDLPFGLCHNPPVKVAAGKAHSA